MSCMCMYMYLGCVKCNIDIDCGNVTILKDYKTFAIFKTFKLLNVYMLTLSATV
jgi:hypothetical protein